VSTRRIVKSIFAREEDLLAATRAVREGGFRIVDVFAPYAIHGIDRAMGLRPSRLTWACFGCGAAGALGALQFQFWTSAVDWPLNVGGKPFNSLPAFIPIAFELTVLCAGLGVVAALLIRCGLRPGRAARVPAERVTNDRFLLVVGSAETPELRTLLDAHGALAVEETLA